MQPPQQSQIPFGFPCIVGTAGAHFVGNKNHVTAFRHEVFNALPNSLLCFFLIRPGRIQFIGYQIAKVLQPDCAFSVKLLTRDSGKLFRALYGYKPTPGPQIGRASCRERV